VGGLLFVNDQSSISNQPSTDFMAYDAYGNAIATVNVTSGSPSARYEYGPFGELLRVTGSMANRSPVRFSTKYQDIETGFTCYGYRFLNTSAGRWLSRDPAVDMPRRWSSDFSNPYHFTLNDPLNFVDTDGRQLFPGGPFPVPFPPIEPGPVDPRPPGWPPNVPYVPKCMRCKCKSVTITGKPVDPPGVGWYAAGSPGNSKGVYGNDMTITWWVSGDPKECTYGQDESGGSLAVPTSGGGGEKQSNYNDHPDVSKLAAITYGQESATYHDQMGIYFSAPRDNGAWEYTLDLMIKFTCTSSDGTKMTGATHHFDDYGTLYFSGHGDE
jgi:RHS repeat-associated protein